MFLNTDERIPPGAEVRVRLYNLKFGTLNREDGKPTFSVLNDERGPIFPPGAIIAAPIIRIKTSGR